MFEHHDRKRYYMICGAREICYQQLQLFILKIRILYDAHVCLRFPMMFNGLGCCLNASISNPVKKKMKNGFRRQPS